MLTAEQKISVNVIPVEILEYDNGSVAFLNPELPTWVRTSITGLWIYQYLKENPGTFSEMVSAVANHYALPTDVVSEATIQFLEEMRYNQFLTPQDADRKEGAYTISKVVELSELNLQELSLDVNSLCFGTCGHCYKPRNDIYHFPLRDLEDLLLQAKTLGVANLTISGGEPLLHPEFSCIMTLARTVSDWAIKVVTAGQGSSAETVDALMENADIVQVSLDGIDEDTNDSIRGVGAFKSAVWLLKLLHEHRDRDRKKVGIAFTPLPQNIDQMQELGEYGYVLDLDFLHFNHLSRPADLSRDVFDHSISSQDLFKKSLQNFGQLTTKMWDEIRDIVLKGARLISVDSSFALHHDLFNLVKKRNCGAGITTLHVTEKGDVYPCAALQAFPETCLGNWVRERDMPELYGRARKWNESVFSVDVCHQCKTCHFRYVCGGGCRARTHSPTQPDIMCEAIMESYQEFFRFAEVLVLKGISAERLGLNSDRKAEANDDRWRSQLKLRQCT